ncbi:hypothetical protein [Psychroflexus lacisalsi]|uniref:Outer membrane protein beta-barrel domain-containing protein n=1 Tax=Psychroflexus lacisalsi TaxID=503928 RepID=A0ABN1K2G9_9FLAO|nr:hypothetical protein [Psychroflexus lacisalsi]MBZ9618602.1 hypothetical protein [Psychroflexus lacisalsi]
MKGLIIKKNKDTLRGFVDDRDWDKNPDQIRFKTRLDSSPSTFLPLDIHGFSVDNIIYVGGVVEAEVTELNTNDLEENPKINIEIDTTFLQVVVGGAKELYYYKNKTDRENFYIKREGQLDLLVYKKYIDEQKNTGKAVVIENKKYLGQLTLYLKECPDINSKLKNTSYNEGDLRRLFNYYYECTSTESSFTKTKNKLSFELGAITGISISSLNFTSYGGFEALLARKNYDSSVNFAGGLFLNIGLPKNLSKWSINNELFYSSYNFKDTFTEVRGENNFTITDTELGYSYIKLNNLVRYTYPIGNTFLYLNAGVSNGFAINETNKLTEVFQFNERRVITEERALEDVRKYEQGLLFGLGVKYNRYSLEFRTESGTGIDLNRNLGSGTRRYFLLLGYRFN